jgi:2'-5' RNA ligase
MSDSLRRLFIAFPFEDKKSVRSLEGVRSALNNDRTLLNIVQPENYHVTLKFFGSVKAEIADSITASFLSLENSGKVEYSLKGVGAFPTLDHPSVIWAGLQCDEKPLYKILNNVELLSSSFGFPPEKRGFVPHLTLARVKKDREIPQYLKEYLLSEKQTFFADSFFSEVVLYESLLKKTGAEYFKAAVINL